MSIGANPIFLWGNDLPQRWQGRARFVMLATGFGAGHDFLAAWQFWRADPGRCARLVYIALDPHPLERDELAAALRESATPGLATALQRAWPPLTRNIHRLSFDDDGVQLLLAIGEVPASLRELVAEVDAFCLVEKAGELSSLSADRVCKPLGRLAANGATLVAASTTVSFRATLATAGFVLRRDVPEAMGDAATLARFDPGFAPRRAPSRVPAQTATEPHALIVGGGLAGCGAAWALAVQGWRSTLLERQAQVATGASGNPAGLFHGIVNAHDGVHARFNRAAALAARAAVQTALDRGVPGSAGGLLRLENTLDVSRMRALLRELALPREYVRALSASEASAEAGLPVANPCWFYPGGGWVQPGGLARSFLECAGALVELRPDTGVHSIARAPGGWRALDASGLPLAEAQTLILANAGDALRLLGSPDWPIESIRGQISLAPASRLALPRLPVAGSGYLLPPIDGCAMFGATAQAGDEDASVRDRDHAANLAQLARLLGHEVVLQPAELRGRTAWRCSAGDRLPVIGAVPDVHAAGTRLDQPRFVPRVPGLFVFSALGSRGITWSALGAQVLASWVTGTPAPLEASLLDAVDPARFVSRRVRRASRG